MSKEKKGIALAGSVIVDKIKEIKAYPESGQLTQISDIRQAVGGLVPNVGLDLKKICPELSVYALGKIGNDEEGAFVSNVLSEGGVDVSRLVKSSTKTSFTDVMSVSGGQRTFFAYPGACAEFGYEDIDFESFSPRVFSPPGKNRQGRRAENSQKSQWAWNKDVYRSCQRKQRQILNSCALPTLYRLSYY